MSTPIVIFEMVEGGGYNSISIDNTAFYVSNLSIPTSGSITVGAVSVNSLGFFINGAQIGGGLGGTSEIPVQDNSYWIGNSEFRWANSWIVLMTANSANIGGIVANSSGYFGTANSTNYVGTVAAASIISASQLSGNLSNYAPINNPVLTGTTNTGNLNVSGNVTISGNLYVDGTTTFFDAQSIITADKTIILANTATTHLLANGSGIIIGPIAQILY